MFEAGPEPPLKLIGREDYRVPRLADVLVKTTTHLDGGHKVSVLGLNGRWLTGFDLNHVALDYGFRQNGVGTFYVFHQSVELSDPAQRFLVVTPERLFLEFVGEVRTGDLLDPARHRSVVQGIDVLCHAGTWSGFRGHE